MSVTASHDEFAFCPDDGYWFRPSYTGGRCPLCGEEAVAGPASVPLWTRLGADRSWFGLGALVLISLVMLGLVLYLYFG